MFNYKKSVASNVLHAMLHTCDFQVFSLVSQAACIPYKRKNVGNDDSSMYIGIGGRMQ